MGLENEPGERRAAANSGCTERQFWEAPCMIWGCRHLWSPKSPALRWQNILVSTLCDLFFVIIHHATNYYLFSAYAAQFLLRIFLCEHQTGVKTGLGVFVSQPFLTPHSFSSPLQPFKWAGFIEPMNSSSPSTGLQKRLISVRLWNQLTCFSSITRSWCPPSDPIELPLLEVTPSPAFSKLIS